MQASRHLVGVIVELTARVQNRHNDLCRRNTLFVLLCRNAAPVIANTHRFIGVNDNVDLATVPRQCLINRVIDDFKDHVVEAGSVVRIANVHAWSFSDGIQTFQYFNTRRVVIGFFSAGGVVFHEISFNSPSIMPLIWSL